MKTTCPLCGFEHEPGDAACRASGCPLASGACQQLHCPRCGYTVPDERASGLARWVRRLFGEPTAHRPGPVETVAPLTEMPTGARGAVVRVDAAPALCAQLAALGIVAGTIVRLTQRHPAFVLEVGETELAVERAVAAVVFVEPGDPGSATRNAASA